MAGSIYIYLDIKTYIRNKSEGNCNAYLLFYDLVITKILIKMTQIFISTQFSVVYVFTISKINSYETKERLFLNKKGNDQ